MSRIRITFALVSGIFLLTAFNVFANGTHEKSAAPTTIKIATIYDPTAGESDKANYAWFESVIKAYEQKYPNVKATTEYFEWDKIDVKMMSDYRAGITSHDVVMSTPQLLPEEAAVGNLADLSSYVSKSFSSSEVADFSWAAPWKKGHINGKVIGIPLGLDTRLLVYNRDMFKAAGLDPNSPPTTLTQLVQDAKALTDSSHYGLGIYMGPQRATIELAFAPLIWGFGGTMWNPTTKKADFASPAGVKAAVFLRDLVTKDGVTPKADTAGSYNDAVLNPFMNGKIAMGWGWGNYWVQPLEAKGWINGLFPPTANGKEVTAGVAVLPTAEHASFDNSWDVSIYARSQHKQDAWNFITMMLKAKTLAGYPDAGLPIRKSLWSGTGYQTPFYKTWEAEAAYSRPMPETAHYGSLADTVAAALQQIVTSNADPATVLDQAQSQYNAQYAGD